LKLLSLSGRFKVNRPIPRSTSNMMVSYDIFLPLGSRLTIFRRS
jgi:hypothetical protein